MSTSDRERLKELERENRELQRANEILRKAWLISPERSSTAGRSDICRQRRIAPSSDYEYKRRKRDPDRLPDRIKRDMKLAPEIQRIWESNFRVYGTRKVWRQLLREGVDVARCTIERLMKKLEIQSARRDRKCWTTVADNSLYRPTGNLRQPGQINCRWQTSHVLQRGRGLFMWLL